MKTIKRLTGTASSIALLVLISYSLINGVILTNQQEAVVMAQSAQSIDEAKVRQMVMAREASAGGQRKIVYLAVVGDYAYVGLADDYTGGVSLYQKERNQWTVVAESGGAYTAKDLETFGVPPDIAQQLVPQN